MSRRLLWTALGLGAVAAVAVYAAGLAPAEAVMSQRGHGIVDLELAGTTARFERILTDWGSPGIEAARSSTHWDFVFIPAYVLVVWSLHRLSEPVGAGRSRWGALVTRLAPVAGLLDVVENVAMLRSLGSPGAASASVALAAACAAGKFAILAAALGVLVTRSVRRAAGSGGSAGRHG